MRAVRPISGVLDAVYAGAPRHDEWLEGVRRAAGEAFEGHDGAQAYTVRVGDRAHIEAVAADEPQRSTLVETHRLGDIAEMRSIYLQRPGMRTSRDFPSDNPASEYRRGRGIREVIGSFGFAEHGRVCAVTFVMERARWRVSREARFALDRLSAHLAASWRLRIHAERPDEAVLAPNGALLDARGDATVKPSRERLRDAALGIVRAKRERDPVSGLAFWRAMVEGRWTLVERFDTDGKRLLLAKRNAPRARAHAALSERERLVIERASLGGSLRFVAYELGLPRSTVSEALARAMKKLGVRDRAELVELYASLC